MKIRESQNHSRLTFLPLSGGRVPEDLDPKTFPGSLGLALEFVEAEQDLQPILRLILGRTLVVRNLDEARTLSAHLPLDARLVTLDGTVVYPTGLVILGSSEEYLAETGSIDRMEQNLTETVAKIQDLESKMQRLDEVEVERESQLNTLQRTIEELNQKIQEAKAKREQYRLELNVKQSEHGVVEEDLEDLGLEQTVIQDQLAIIQNKIEQFNSRKSELDKALQAALLLGEGEQSELIIAQAQTRFDISQRVYEGVERRLRDLSDQLEEVEGDLDFKNDRLNSIRAELAETTEETAQRQQSQSSLEKQIAEAQEKIEPEEKALGESEEIRTELETEEMNSRSELQRVEREHSRAQISLARRQEELVSLQRRIEDDFGLVTFDFENGVMGQDPLPFEGLVEHLPRAEEVSEDMEKQVNRLRIQLRRLGSVSPSAKIEYDEVRNRVDFLTSQLEDSRSAEAQIHNVITELDLLMEREFRKTFDAVAIEFQQAFAHLFGGGSGRLNLTNSDDLTQTGIDIEARLPGRREQGLAMLSGGERSLTACALIFALMKVSPTPFCVLDEVDAMLDDVNVIRFREMLQDLSKNTQFVVITHNRMTVQVAEVVYGVTMGSDSSSQIISLRLEDAEKVLEGRG